MVDRYTIKSLAAAAGVRQSTVKRMIEEGEIKATIIKRPERNRYVIFAAAAQAFIAASRTTSTPHRPLYPRLTPAQFGASLEALYLSGSVRSEGWIRAAWLVLVRGKRPMEAAAKGGITISGLTRPLKRISEAAEKLKRQDIAHYSDALPNTPRLSQVLREARRRWREIQLARVELAKAKRMLKNVRGRARSHVH